MEQWSLSEGIDGIMEKTGLPNGVNSALGRCFPDTEISTYQNKTVTAGPLLIKNTSCAFLLAERMTEIAEKGHPQAQSAAQQRQLKNGKD